MAHHPEDRVTLIERVSVALADGNLRQSPGPCALDTVMALGVVGISERMSDAVLRLKGANDHSAYGDAVDGVYGIARSLDRRENWRLKRWRLRLMASSVIDFWLNELCRTCHGVKFEVAGSTGRLSSHVCKACHGTGRRRAPWDRKIPAKPEGRRARGGRVERWKKVAERLRTSAERHRRLLIELEATEARVEVEMRRRLTGG